MDSLNLFALSSGLDAYLNNVREYPLNHDSFSLTTEKSAGWYKSPHVFTPFALKRGLIRLFNQPFPPEKVKAFIDQFIRTQSLSNH